MSTTHRVLFCLALAAVGLVSSASAAGAAPATFASREVAGATANGPSSVAIGDLNGDGRPDLATADYYDGRVTVTARNAAGTGWESPRNAGNTSTGPYSVAIRDLNGDGRPDLATADADDGRVTVIKRNAAGTGWEAPQSAGDTGRLPVSIDIGDLNGDGRLDIATADLDGDTVTIIERNSAGTAWESPQSLGTGDRPVSVAIGDLNGDGRLDIATADSDGDRVTVIQRNAAGTGWEAPVSAGTTGSSPVSVAIGDLNGDGRPDLATADANSDRLTVIQRNAAGTGWEAPVSAGTTGSSPASVAIGDLNGDSKPDLATADYDGNSVTVVQRNAAGNGWESPLDESTGTTPNSVGIGDLDADGQPDLVTADQASNTVSVLRNTTDLVAPISTDDVPAAAASLPVTVTLQATDLGGSGVAGIRYRVVAADGSLGPQRTYDPAARPTLGAGERLEYQAVDNAGNLEPAHRSNVARLAATQPPGGPGAGNGGAPLPPSQGTSTARPVVVLRGISSSSRGRQLTVTLGTNVAGTVEAIATHDGPGGRPRALTPGRGRITYARTGPRRTKAGRTTVRLTRTASAARTLRRYTRRNLRLRVTVRIRPTAGGPTIQRTTTRTVRVR